MNWIKTLNFLELAGIVLKVRYYYFRIQTLLRPGDLHFSSNLVEISLPTEFQFTMIRPSESSQIPLEAQLLPGGHMLAGPPHKIGN
jgi:hypothetical protein